MTLAEILALGDELVHGKALDTNSRHISSELEAAGLQVGRFTVAGDDPEDLQAVMAEACGRARVVVATGGLGPTEDDRTREAAAALAGVPVELHKESLQALEEFAAVRRRRLPESNRRQAYLPRGATVLPNPVGTAPGFRMQVGDCTLFALPGVPREMRVMLTERVLPWVEQHVPGLQPFATWNLRVLGLSEAALGERIAAFMAHDREPRVGITANSGLMTLRIVGRGSSGKEALAACKATADQLRPLVRDVLVCEGEHSLLDQAVSLLIEKGMTFTTAESCTGGLLAARLTEVPGISSVFLGGFVPYSNAAKIRDLAVRPALLAERGAVSEPVALAMAEGAVRRTGARLGVGITGIAGPEGGTPDKPVGTVCFGLCCDEQARAWTLAMGPLGRTFIRERSVLEALVAMLRASDNGEQPS